MKVAFTKMQGCGNDYIYFNCFTQNISEPELLSRRLSDRRKGVGSDGIILICPSETAAAKMRIFNADGSEAKMCGNGIRCVGKYLYDSGLARQTELNVETLSGSKHLSLYFTDERVETVRVDMGKAELVPQRIPVLLPGMGVIHAPLKAGEKIWKVTCVSIGNPHCVIFCSDVNAVVLEETGPLFESNSLFPEGVNTEFVQVLGKHTLRMRVWERGSGETHACGTGACAAAVAAVLDGYCCYNEEIVVELLGGKLSILYQPDGEVFMTGEAKTVFQGEVEV